MAKKSAAEKVGLAVPCEPPHGAHGVPRPTSRAKRSALVDTRVIDCGERLHAATLEQFKKLPDACIDLIYIDPPFNSNRNCEGPSRTDEPMR